MGYLEELDDIWRDVKSGWKDEHAMEFEEIHIQELRNILRRVQGIDDEVNEDILQVRRLMWGEV